MISFNETPAHPAPRATREHPPLLLNIGVLTVIVNASIVAGGTVLRCYDRCRPFHEHFVSL